MSKRKRRDQQHLGQASTRRRTYRLGGSASQDGYKPGFPMNILGNIKLFAIIGVVVIVGFGIAALFTNRANQPNDDRVQAPTPASSPTATGTADAAASPAASATAAAKTFPRAEQVIDAAKTNYAATIKTSKGDIQLNLFAAAAPNTVNSFVFLAKQGFFDGIKFHRVVPDFVIQGGDPTGTGAGGPGYQTNDEPNQMKNKTGTISMAKTQGAKAFGSQWFINLKDNTSLDFDSGARDQFYPFGEVTGGLDVVKRIAQNDLIQTIVITESPK